MRVWGCTILLRLYQAPFQKSTKLQILFGANKYFSNMPPTEEDTVATLEVDGIVDVAAVITNGVDVTAAVDRNVVAVLVFGEAEGWRSRSLALRVSRRGSTSG